MAFLLRIILLLSTGFSPTILASECGYPGSPLHGRPDTVQELYSEGQMVTYACNIGYFMMGPGTRTCLTNGTWTGRIPLCDTSLSSTGKAEISKSLSRYSASLAIDGKPDTCTFTSAQSPRWWRLDMGMSYRVLSVGLTLPITSGVEQRFSVYILGLSGNSAIYQRCAAFSGKLASSSVFLVCGEGTGITGRYIHIEDHRKDILYFGLCEIDVMIVKEHYDCGLPDRPARSYTMRLKPEQVEYRCVSGYKLVGPKQRQCLTNGQWSHTQPLCIEVNCESVDNFTNGRVKISPLRDRRPVMGSTATYVCDEGYLLEGNATRECLDTGHWNGTIPYCKSVDCGELPQKQYVLLNDTSRFESVARLICQEGYHLIGETPLIRCRGDGAWSRPKAKCILPATSVKQSASQEAGDRGGEPSLSIGLIIGVIGAVAVIGVVVAYVLFRRRRKNVDGSCLPRDDAMTLSSGAGSCQSLVTNGYQDNGFTRQKSNNNVTYGHYDHPKPRVLAPTYSFSVIPAETVPSPSGHSSLSSRENIYEEIAPGAARRKTFPFDQTTDDTVDKAAVIPGSVSDVYAQVDFKKKRESRLLRDDVPLECELTPPSTPVVLRELPPIPPDDETASPCGLAVATFVVENDIYEASSPQLKQTTDVVVDNELYS